MSFEAGMFSVYALVLTAVAAGLHRLGRMSTDPRASRMLAAYRHQTGDVPTGPAGAADPDWPHGEVPRLYTAIAAVAAAAGVALMVMELVHHETLTELAVELVVATACAAVLARMLAQLFVGSGRRRSARVPAANRIR